jgi:hypothetical protein
MFNAAARGLQSQGWQQCRVRENLQYGFCAYNNGKGCHCAWGWVDPTIPYGADGNIRPNLGDVTREIFEQEGITGEQAEYYLSRRFTAPNPKSELLKFALKLQDAHDKNKQPYDMQFAFLLLVDDYQLRVPDDVDLGLGLGQGGYHVDPGSDE